jgi:hypothetical protein
MIAGLVAALVVGAIMGLLLLIVIFGEDDH